VNPLKYAITTAALLAFAGFPSASAATIVYDGGTPDQGGIYYADAGIGFSDAMSFSLSPGITVTGANWWGGCYSPSSGGGTCGGSQFELTIWSNNMGSPGSVVDFMPVLGAVNETATGNLIGGSSGYPEYSYNATFTLATPLTAGTEYWFVIQQAATEPSGFWGDETTSNAPAGEQLQQNQGAGFMPQDANASFQLTGTQAATPLPAALPLFATGLGALGLLGWRRKRKAAAIAV
jgi:hypothetical protein